MYRRTKKKLLGLLETFGRKVQRAQETGTPSAFERLVPQTAMLRHVAEAELAADERQPYEAALTKIEQALGSLPMGTSACQELGMRLSQSVEELRQRTEGIEAKRLIVFLPYKSSMWDSLESIWEAASRDRAYCRTMVICLPYADRNPDGTPSCWHYEIDKFPKHVPVLHHESVDLAALHPDVIFVHNPYDNYNSVTSVDMKYYSDKLKKMTDCLIYVPYYVTSGGMGEFQRNLASYANFDYIIAQGKAGMPYFDEKVQDRLVPLGSPKLDKVVQMCKHPPVPPKEWRDRLAGRTVYFYNTSLSGFIGDTKRFLKKMRYVFEAFRGREDACLIWRPHPLLEATLHTMREAYVEEFESLRDMFLEDGIGILDTTPEIEPTIALSDVYLGDSGTSVTALFGAAGKALFIFNNRLHALPREDGWRSTLFSYTPYWEDGRWLVTPTNGLWCKGQDDVFHFVAQLSDYESGSYFTCAYERQGKLFLCPLNGQEVLVLDHGDVRHIALPKSDMPYPGRFAGALADDRYLFLLPLRYPYLIRIDLRTEQVVHVDGIQERFATKTQEDDWFAGGSLLKDGMLYLASPATEDVLVFQEETLQHQLLKIGSGTGGANVIAQDGEDLYLLPLEGSKVRRWNPQKGTLRVYDAAVEGFSCYHPTLDCSCSGQAFSQAAFTQDKIILSPLWGSGFVAIDKETGHAEPWDAPAPMAEEAPDAYFYIGMHGTFVRNVHGTVYRYFNWETRRLFEVDVATRACQEIPLNFDTEEVRAHAPGFAHLTEWLQYGCEENALHTLPELLDGTLPGAAFDAAAERKAYDVSAANVGTCGEKVYAWLKSTLENAEEMK